MRRGFSIFLILIFGFGPLTSLIDGSEDANLPACCRRNGAHHCAMSVRMAAVTRQAATGKTPMVSVPMTCPYYPGAIALLSTPARALVVTAGTGDAQIALTYVPVATHASPFATPARTHAGRGPPASTIG
jgi:hypothetical protein